MPATALATPSVRLWWVWTPTSVSGFSASRNALTRSAYCAGRSAPAEFGHIDAFGAVALHQLGLLDQLLGRGHVRHHQEADRVHAELARRLDMLPGDVGLGAMGGDAHAARARVIGVLEVVHRADARQQQHGDDGVLALLGDRRDPLAVVVRAEAVVEGRRR